MEYFGSGPSQRGMNIPLFVNHPLYNGDKGERIVLALVLLLVSVLPPYISLYYTMLIGIILANLGWCVVHNSRGPHYCIR